MSVSEIIKEYVEAYKSSPTSGEYQYSFGIRIKNHSDWFIKRVSGNDISLQEGFPDKPFIYYILDEETLNDIYNSRLNALTAMGKAKGIDTAPMDIEFHNGFKPDNDFFNKFIPFSFQFWTRGQPKIVSFGSEYSRLIHGGNATALYYQKGLRTAWYQIEKGQHINRDESDQSNPFPSLFVFIKGKAMGCIGGEKTEFNQGQSVFVPENVTHEFWNEENNPAEFILIMFGKNA